ncbi:MAG: hypothetical protein LBU05_07690 [Bifidobacteriaceae bacterium]|jgi:hypothetical protein|nr:hypothetical protein [Bifidobacteriaceae bacterium]
MLTREIFREAGRNLATGTSRMLVLATAAGAVMAALAAADGRAVAGLIDANRTYQAQAATTWVVKAPGQIDPAACESLNRLANVTAAGAIKPADPGLTSGLLPRNPITRYLVTPAFTDLLDDFRTSGRPGLILSSQVAAVLGAEVGQMIALTGGQADVAGTYTYPDDGRTPGLGWAVLEPTNAQTGFDECWVGIAPDSAAVRALLATSARFTPGDQTSPQVTQLNSTLGPPADQAAAFHARQTSPAPAVAATAAALIAAAAVWARRLELAAARHARVPRLASMVQLATEAAAWLALAAAATAPVIAHYAVHAGGLDTADVAWALARIPLAGFAAGMTAAFATTTAVREKRLFTYFKTR